MPFSEILGKYINNIFSGKYLVSNESDFKMLLEHDLLKDFDPSRISTEYEYSYRSEDYRTDIIIWDGARPTKIDYAVEVKYIITNGKDIHGNVIGSNGSHIDKYESDLKKMNTLKIDNKILNGYAVYVTDSIDYVNSAIDVAEKNEFQHPTKRILNVNNGKEKITLYALIAYI